MSERAVIGLIALFIALGIGAYFYGHEHAQRYSNCIIKPGLLEWPNGCGGEINQRR